MYLGSAHGLLFKAIKFPAECYLKLKVFHNGPGIGNLHLWPWSPNDEQKLIKIGENLERTESVYEINFLLS